MPRACAVDLQFVAAAVVGKRFTFESKLGIKSVWILAHGWSKH